MTRPTPLIIALVALAMVMPLGAKVTFGAERKKGPDRFVGLTFKEPKQTEFLKAVLQSMNLNYTATATADGELVEWASNDPAQDREIQNRVSQFWFISTQCDGMRPPPPSQPSRATLSCQK
jgi:hypothetical protein